MGSRGTAPRLITQTEKKVAALAQQAAVRNMTSHTTTVVTVTRGTTKVITTTATQTFAAKLTETTTSQLMVTVSQEMAVNKPRSTTLSIPSSTVGPISPQLSQSFKLHQTSPKHHRPVPPGSAPPNMQHFQAPCKMPFPNSVTQGVLSNTTEHNVNLGQQRSTTPINSSANQNLPLDEVINVQGSSSIQTPQEYSLFNTKPMAQQSMWRENESQKAINFAAVTGGGNTQASVPPTFIEQEPPQVDASKAPGYRGTAVCSPVSSKTSSNSTTPPNMPLTAAPGYQTFSEPKSQPLPPIGSTIMHNRPPSQTNQNDLAPHYYSGSEHPSRSIQHLTHSDTNLYKSGVTSFSENNPMLTMSSNDGQPLLQAFHPSNSLQHINYSQSQALPQPAVSVSRLNPKAPDFSSSMHTITTKQGPQIYNGYQMGNQSNNGCMYPIGKPLVNNFPRTALPNPQSRWLMQMQHFTPQNEIISGMAGMTLHNLARATGGEILENGADLGVVNNSPAMSPNLSGPHTLHPNEASHYMEERKPQPIGTERARKTFNPIQDNWMLNSDSKMMMNRSWVGGAGGGGGGGNMERISMQRNQIYDDFSPHIMDSSYQVR